MRYERNYKRGCIFHCNNVHGLIFHNKISDMHQALTINDFMLTFTFAQRKPRISCRNALFIKYFPDQVSIITKL